MATPKFNQTILYHFFTNEPGHGDEMIKPMQAHVLEHHLTPSNPFVAWLAEVAPKFRDPLATIMFSRQAVDFVQGLQMGHYLATIAHTESCQGKPRDAVVEILRHITSDSAQGRIDHTRKDEVLAAFRATFGEEWLDKTLLELAKPASSEKQ